LTTNSTCLFVFFVVRVEVAPNGNKILSFSGDAEEGDDDPAVDLFAVADETGDADAEGDDDDGDGADEAEPEDDFNAAWEVLDLARAIYEKGMGGDDRVQLKAADTLIALGDVSLETGAYFFILCFKYNLSKEEPFLSFCPPSPTPSNRV
jgi:hypothetical protein